MKKSLLITFLLFLILGNIVAQDATISIPNISGVTANTEVLVPVNITTLNEVGSITLHIKFDSSVMSFTGDVENNSIAGGFFSSGTKGDTIVTISWFGSNAINLDGKMFDLKFNYFGGTSPLEFDFVEITNTHSDAYNIAITNGSISESAASPAKMGLNDVKGVPGDTVIVNLSGSNLVNVGSMNLYIEYDTTKTEFLGIGNINLPNFISNAAKGIVSLGMFNAQGFNHASGVVANLKFLAIKGGKEDLIFKSNSTVGDKDLNPITVEYTNGSITISDAEILLSNITTPANRNIMISLSARNIIDLGSFNLDIDFDVTSLTFVAVHDSTNGGVFSTNIDNGILKLGYINTNGVTMSDGVIANLEFAYTTGNSNLVFDKTTASVQNTSLEDILVLLVDGSVTEQANQPPKFVNVLPDTTITEAQDLTFLYTGVDPDGDSLIFALVSHPTGATLDVNGNFAWTPTYDQAGVYEVVVSLSDGTYIVSDTTTITVTDDNREPYFTKTMPDTTVTEGIELSYQYAGEDPDGSALTFEIFSAPSGATISTDGLFSWTPATPNDIVATIIVALTDQITTVYDTAEVSVLTGIDGVSSDIPDKYALGQNYPNPFNPSTTIQYNLPENSMVNLTVYDVTGQKITTLLDSEIAAGYHKISFDASELAGGVYLLRMTALGLGSTQTKFSVTKKMLLIK